MAYVVPATAEERKSDLDQNLAMYNEGMTEFKEKGKKAAALRAKKALTIVKKLLTAIRKDIQVEIDSFKK